MRIFRSIDLAARWPFLALAKRDVLRNVREQRLLLWSAVMLVVATLAIMIEWPGGVPYGAIGPQVSSYTFGILKGMWAFWAFILIPSYASRGFVEERDQGTYDLLYLTLITPRGIVLAKVASAVGTFLVLLIATAPAAGVLFFLPGLDLRHFIFTCASVAASAILWAAVGTACSAVHRRAGAALLSSYGFTILAFFLVTCGTSPFGLMTETLAALGSLTVFLLLSLGICLVVALPNTAPRSRLPDIPPHYPAHATSGGRRALQRTYGLIDDGVNPIDAYESRTNRFAPHTQRISMVWRDIVAGTFVGLLVVLTGGLTMNIVKICAAFVPAIYLAGTINREIERNTFDSLRMTLMTPAQVLAGKTRALFRKMKWLGVALLVQTGILTILWMLVQNRNHWLLGMSWVKTGTPSSLVMSLGGMVGLVCLSIAAGMFAATTATNTRTAQTLAAGLVTVLWLISSAVSWAITAVWAISMGSELSSDPFGWYLLSLGTKSLPPGQTFLLFLVNFLPITAFGLALMFMSLGRIRAFWAPDV